MHTNDLSISRVIKMYGLASIKESDLYGNKYANKANFKKNPIST